MKLFPIALLFSVTAPLVALPAVAGPQCLPYIRDDGTPGIICRQQAAVQPPPEQFADDTEPDLATSDCYRGSRDCFPTDRVGLKLGQNWGSLA